MRLGDILIGGIELITSEWIEARMNTIINDDCLNVMKQVPDKYFDLVLTDPPYGIGEKFKGGTTGKMNFNEVVEKGWDVKPSDEIFKEIFRISKNQIIWGGNYFNLPATRGFIIWDKQISEDFSLAMAEYAWTSYDQLAKIYRASSDKIGRLHPTQKPERVIEYSLNYAKVEKHFKIYDPFMGSGTTAVACQSLGIDWCGCELEPDYVAIANKRLERVQGSLF